MGYHQMSEEERWAFLAAVPTRPGILSTTRADGRPHVAPVWYDLDDRTIVFTTGAGTVKGRNLARDGRAALCVQDDRPPFSFVVVEATASLSDDPAEVRRWATRIGRRYMGAERAEEFGARNGVPGELLVRLTPVRTTGAKDVSE